VDRSFSYSKIDFALQQNNREHEQQMQETTNLISNIADVTSEIANELIEGDWDYSRPTALSLRRFTTHLTKRRKKKKSKIHL
jgi:hypothetical protein